MNGRCSLHAHVSKIEGWPSAVRGRRAILDATGNVEYVFRNFENSRCGTYSGALDLLLVVVDAGDDDVLQSLVSV